MTTPRTAEERVAAQFSSPWLRHYVPWKLRLDPLYPAAASALGASLAPIVDIGCGVGLLAFYLRERGLKQPITGIDTDEAKIGAAAAIATQYPDIKFRVCDARALGELSGSFALLDVLHYMPDEEQAGVLETVAGAVSPGGAVVIRDAVRDGSWRYRMTVVEETFAKTIGWLRVPMLRFPQMETIVAPFRERGFVEEIRPLWGRTPFNNYLFVFRRPASS
ncbi:MAG: class I SAM-dependent methyltransferase [Thermoanaerobaculia bacterium]